MRRVPLVFRYSSSIEKCCSQWRITAQRSSTSTRTAFSSSSSTLILFQAETGLKLPFLWFKKKRCALVFLKKMNYRSFFVQKNSALLCFFQKNNERMIFTRVKITYSHFTVIFLQMKILFFIFKNIFWWNKDRLIKKRFQKKEKRVSEEQRAPVNFVGWPKANWELT